MMKGMLNKRNRRVGFVIGDDDAGQWLIRNDPKAKGRKRKRKKTHKQQYREVLR